MVQKNLKKNYIYNVTYQILNVIIPLIIAPYLSRTLGPNGVGTVSFVESIVSYFTLFATLGITSFGQREISYVQDDIRKRSLVFWNTKILGFCTSGIVLLIYFVFSIMQGENSTIYLILSLNIIAVFFDITWFFQGIEEFGKIVLRNTIIKILQVVFIFIFVKNKEDILIYIIGISSFTVLGNISLWSYLSKYICRINISELKPFKNIKVVLSLFLPTIAIQIYTVLDKTMIGIITGSSFENGYYEQAVKISRILLSIVTALGPVVVPQIGYLYERKEFSEIQKILYRSYRFSWFLGIPICLGIMVSASNFVPWFFGPGYEKVISLLQILALIVVAIGINSVISSQYLVPTKRQNLLTATLMIGAATNFCLNIILIKYLQSIGAAIASVMAESVIAIVQLILMRKEISPLRVLKEGVHYYIAGTVMAVLLIPISKILSPSLINTMILVITGATIYFVTLLIEKDKFMLNNMKSIMMKIKEKI